MTIYKKLYQQTANKLFENNPFTWVYGLARTILALGLLITLLFSPIDVLFDYNIFHNVNTQLPYSSINFFVLMGWENLGLAKVIAVVVLLVTASGFYPRYTGVFHWWIAISFFHASSLIEGGDQINAIICLLLVPVTLLDHRKWHWSKNNSFNDYSKIIGNTMFILVAIQMAIVYLNAASDKFYSTSEEWKLGNAFYYFAQDSYFSYPEWMDPLMNNLMANSFFVSGVTWGTIFLELLLFGVLFSNKKIKYALFPLAALFHFSIVLFLGLTTFFLAMLGGLIIYLVPKDLKPIKITDYIKNRRFAIPSFSFLKNKSPSIH